MQPTIIRLGGPSNAVRVETFEDAYSNAKGRGRARRVERQQQKAAVKVAKQEKKQAKAAAKAETKAIKQEARQAKRDTRVARKVARKDTKVAARTARKEARVGSRLGVKEAKATSRAGRKNLRTENRLLRRTARKATRMVEDDTLPEDELEEDIEAGYEEEAAYDDSGAEQEGGDDGGYYEDEESEEYYDESGDDEGDDEGYDDGGEEEEYYEEEGEEESYDEAAGQKEEFLTDLMASPFSGDMSFTPNGNDDIRDMSFSEAAGKRRGKRRVRRSRKTVIRNVENPQISPNRIVVPAEERASGANYGVDGTRTGLIGLDARDDYDAPKKREIYLNATGAEKTVGGINVKSAVIGVIGAVALIWLANKSGLIKKA